jgi:hypothetical protein
MPGGVTPQRSGRGPFTHFLVHSSIRICIVNEPQVHSSIQTRIVQRTDYDPVCIVKAFIICILFFFVFYFLFLILYLMVQIISI